MTASIALGTGFIAYGVAAFAESDALMEMAKSAYAIAAIPFALAVTVDHDARIGPTLSGGSATLAVGAASAAATACIAWWIASIANRYALVRRALIAYGAACIAFGAVGIADHSLLPGAGSIALGAGSVVLAIRAIGPRTIVARVRRTIDWATKAPEEVEALETESGTGEN
jgi:hypothetical protein